MTTQTRGKRGVFLDRDGVIIRQVDLLTNLAKVKILPGAAEAIRRLNRLGFPVIVITNQPVIARGLIPEEGIAKMNQAIGKRLARSGARVDAWYVCPHHPKATLSQYRKRCGCRKPGAKMLRDGARDLKLDLKRSWMVGDSLIDIVAGKRAGAMTILVATGPGHARLDKKYKVRADLRAKDLRQAARLIQRQK